ncbi:HNH endonuclease [Acinetobacter guillouiae]|uniref:HNH endonuclease n=1 Tax=Acinetobacter guillouiae TaxID=106649 RepID=A0A8X8GNC5_ACIGI|nr:HNH endonuclease [Acinetobacter guillouiae]MCF0266068.1 HNH endonuclease [Acinetobacter guillouiae]
MTKITTLMTKRGYELSKAVFYGSITRDEALDELENDYGMNRGSVNDYINGFKSMIKGKEYKRTFNKEATDFFLENIYLDFGIDVINFTLQAVRRHIDYYQKLRNVNLKSIESIYQKHKNKHFNNNLINGDELDESIEYMEGSKKIILVNAYERNSDARDKCISHYGLNCYVCGFNFETKYGDIGSGFIHVHHLKLISAIGLQYKIDPIDDLKPVCPNCHAMIHKKNPPFTIEELKEIIIKNKYPS